LIVKPPTTTTSPTAEPFRYGWRYVRTSQPDGSETVEQVPLTLLDVLHPQEDDCIPENSWHERQRRYSHNVFEKQLALRPTLLTLSDCLIDWQFAGLRGHSPDLIVLERDQPWPWRSWSILHVIDERARPLLIMELVSPSTRSNDVVDKVDHYHRVGVPLYVIVDQEEEEGPLKLIGYRHAPGKYELLPLDSEGRLLLEPFGLYLKVEGQRVVILDAVTGKELGDYTAVCAALEAETRARQAAEVREQEQRQARAAAEEAHAAEKAAREQAEARASAAEKAMQELRAELQRLRGGNPTNP
jgi:Uma2 family endonuclease